MTEATPAQRKRAYTLFSELIERSLVKLFRFRSDIPPAILAKHMVELLWPYVSADDETILDATVMVTEIRDALATKRLTREQVVGKCDEVLVRLRENQKDDKGQ